LKYYIGVREYPTKTAAQEAIRKVLYRYQPGETVGRPEDQEFLADLVQNHPDPASKIGVGIARFEVRRNLKTPGFWIIRTDGSDTDFSFVKCLRPPTHPQLVRTALRRSVDEQIWQFRDHALGGGQMVCSVSGDPIDRLNCHVDHDDPTFSDLVDAYVAAHGGYEAFQVVETVDGAFGRRLADAQVEVAWQAWHKANANLRLVSIRANLSLLRRHTRTVVAE
jgi:hypothetical protein